MVSNVVPGMFSFSSPFFFASSSSSSFNQKDIDPSIYFYGAVILCPGVVKKPNLLAVAVWVVGNGDQ